MFGIRAGKKKLQNRLSKNLQEITAMDDFVKWYQAKKWDPTNTSCYPSDAMTIKISSHML